MSNEEDSLKALNFKKSLRKTLQETNDKNIFISAIFDMVIETVQSRHITKEEFLSTASHMWDHCVSEKERLSRSPLRKRNLVKALFGDVD